LVAYSKLTVSFISSISYSVSPRNPNITPSITFTPVALPFISPLFLSWRVLNALPVISPSGNNGGKSGRGATASGPSVFSIPEGELDRLNKELKSIDEQIEFQKGMIDKFCPSASSPEQCKLFDTALAALQSEQKDILEELKPKTIEEIRAATNKRIENLMAELEEFRQEKFQPVYDPVYDLELIFDWIDSLDPNVLADDIVPTLMYEYPISSLFLKVKNIKAAGLFNDALLDEINKEAKILAVANPRVDAIEFQELKLLLKEIYANREVITSSQDEVKGDLLVHIQKLQGQLEIERGNLYDEVADNADVEINQLLADEKKVREALVFLEYAGHWANNAGDSGDTAHTILGGGE